jgi:Xylose isomerase-like TIM barrel.
MVRHQATEIALSSGCFINQEQHLATADIHAVELSSHSEAAVKEILTTLSAKGVRILSVHCPCPSRGSGLNLGGEGESWQKTSRSIEEGMNLASAVGAKYLVIHAFYCIPNELPSDDFKRAEFLRTFFGDISQGMAEYVKSDYYRECRHNAIVNLKTILPALKKKYPKQKIVLENLNPRIGYGGILLSDVKEIAESLDGDVGICLDVGHLSLSAAALEVEFEQVIIDAKDMILTTHLHQNFSGRYCVDRNWYSDVPTQVGLQEVDIHLPLTGQYRVLGKVSEENVNGDNSAFKSILQGVVQYEGSNNSALHPDVPVERWLSLLNRSTHRVFEFDSRYAPIKHILDEINWAQNGKHPLNLFGG